MSISPSFNILAVDMPPWLGNHLGLWVALLIVVIGLFGIGLRDVLRFSIRRVWAISGVCFDESIRRKILWITPLAILGVLAVSQLQRASDEQDAIRQITKFCLFGTGLVVVIAVLILASSSLPREIENRVIYTIVTKPTTRLEILLGKIVGFARVSALILLIMGFFTWGYLQIRAYSLQKDIRDRLAMGDVEAINRPTLEHYVNPNGQGLLNAKTLAMPKTVQIYAKMPTPGDPRRWFAGGGNGLVLVPFVLPHNALLANPDAPATALAMAVRLSVGYQKQAIAPVATPAVATSQPFTGPSPLVASTRPVTKSAAANKIPRVTVQIYNANQNTIITREINGGNGFDLRSPQGSPISFVLPVSAARDLAKTPYFYVGVTGESPHTIYSVKPGSAHMLIAVANKPKPVVVEPADPNDPSKPGALIFKGQISFTGQRLKGDPVATAPICDFHYLNTPVQHYGTGKIPVELRVTIEQNDEHTVYDTPVDMSLQVVNNKTGKLYDAGTVHPENNRVVFGNLPAKSLAGGDFDVLLRCLTPGDYIGLTDSSFQVVRAENSFVWNLFKSLLVIWLLSILVIAIAIFCSTFLSWPIAVVLTLVLLLGQWGVQELGDATSAGLGRQFVQDFGVSNPAQAQALSTSVEQLNRALTTFAVVLPDINQFSATDDISRGVNISLATLLDAVAVLLSFGIPLTVLAYIFLKNKEVAP